MQKDGIEEFVHAFQSAAGGSEKASDSYRLSRFLRDAAARGGTVYFVGNGASASISSTLAFKCHAEQSVSSLALTDHNLLLGLSRKGSFSSWMADCLRTILRSEDALVLTSSSGESENVLEAARVANQMNIPTFSLTGFAANNQLRGMTSDQLWVDSHNYNVVESAHLWLGLTALRGVHGSQEDVLEDHDIAFSELSSLEWAEITASLALYATELASRSYQRNRIIFLGDGSSASLASHLATDFSKSGLTAQTINDHNFLSAAQNDFGAKEWLCVGFDRTYRSGDEIMVISHGDLFPAETALVQRMQALEVSFSFHGTCLPSIAQFSGRIFLYPVMHPVNELVLPSIGLLAIAEAFLITP